MWLIVDASYLLHRILRQKTPTPAAQLLGVDVFGPSGFLMSLRNYIDQFKAVRHVALVWDGGRSSRRMSLLPEYKKRRTELLNEEEEIKYAKEWVACRDQLIRVSSSFGLHSLLLPGREGDDVCGHLTRLVDTSVVVSDDSDFLQLVCDACVVFRPMADVVVGKGNFSQAYKGIPHGMFLLYKALLGDKSDSIPGIDGVGEVTARKVICEIHEDGNSKNVWECSADEIRSRMVTACLRLSDTDTRSKPKYLKIVKSVSSVIRNLDLVDVSKEQLTPEEWGSLSETLRSVTPMDNMKALGEFQAFGLTGHVKSWTTWSEPFRRIS